MAESENTLKYFISRKNTILVVSFLGGITDQAESTFNQCIEEILQDKPIHIILNLQGVRVLENKGIPHFIRFQKNLRDKIGSLHLCFLSSDILKFCQLKAAVRDDEVKKDLITTLKSLINR